MTHMFVVADLDQQFNQISYIDVVKGKAKVAALALFRSLPLEADGPLSAMNATQR